MFSEKLQPLVDLITRANEQYDAEHPEASTALGVTNESLRALGDDSDAVSVECPRSRQRLMFIMKDSIPGKVGIGVGCPGTEDLQFLGEMRLADMDELYVRSLMEQYFRRKTPH
ncbi:hypothetical protein [Natronospira bacteriovora]|uniref:Uncharacterized protein n=1 Tax=Natronospira bacteriovora TaxID=3069753 RepID=A0ABU0W3R8_9GAMM|nr:hypothetical protein [Natronospira sp. AB-CW4]MDQ2068612.1 hypothetical protein [Natronospira sp. AB-CW4]